MSHHQKQPSRRHRANRKSNASPRDPSEDTSSASRTRKIFTLRREHRDPAEDPANVCHPDDFIESRPPVGRGSRKFALDFSGFSKVMENSYMVQTCGDRGLRKYLPFSMWQYYCTILLWKRVWQVVSINEGFSACCIDLEDMVPDDLAVPDDISAYLSGIGDIKHSNYYSQPAFFTLTQVAKLTDMEINSVSGFYGRINQENHYMYETMPSPGIAVMQMGLDLGLELTSSTAPWDLENEFSKPTANLLGWRVTTPLHFLQKQTLHNAGIYLSQDKRSAVYGVQNVHNLPISQRIIQTVSQYLKSSKLQRFAEVDTLPYGSLAQIPFVTRLSTDCKLEIDRGIGWKQGMVQSSHSFSTKVFVEAEAFRYRVNRTMEGAMDWACLTKNDSEHSDPSNLVPDKWEENANFVFNYGAAGDRWNKSNYQLSS